MSISKILQGTFKLNYHLTTGFWRNSGEIVLEKE